MTTPAICHPHHQPHHYLQWDGTRSGPAGIAAMRQLLASDVVVRGDTYGQAGLGTIVSPSGRTLVFATGDYVVADGDGMPVVVCGAGEFKGWFEVDAGGIR